MAKRMMLICDKEGLKVNEATMHALVEGSNGDLRLILGQLQVSLESFRVGAESERGRAGGRSPWGGEGLWGLLERGGGVKS